MEEWRDIKGFEGKYMVSNLGRVKSLNYRRTGKEKILKAYPNKDDYGYLKVSLYKDGKVRYPLVHVLVATAFLENPDNLPEVNHKDENSKNNCVENLEYCSRLYNVNYGTRNKKVAEKISKPVFSVDKESGLIMWWQSASEAGRILGITKQSICACCKGRKYKSAGGFYWFYADEDDDTE